MIAEAAEQRGRGLGRIRPRRIATADRRCLHGLIGEMVEPGSTIRTDGLNAYLELTGYTHERHV